LEPSGNIHNIPMQVGAIRNGITQVDPNAKADGSVGRLAGIVSRNVLLNLRRTANCAVYAIEDYEQRVAAGVDEPATVFLDCWVNKIAPEGP
jgi:hypothetical protein